MSMVDQYIPQQYDRDDIDWHGLLKRRNFLIEHVEDVPAYLLLPEIRALLHQVTNPETHLLINTIWHCGPRITEALMLTPELFLLDDPDMSVVKIPTLKKRKRTPKRRGRPSKATAPTYYHRIVPLYAHAFKSELLTYCAAHRIYGNQPLFPHTRDAYNKRLKKVQAELANKGMTFPMPISPHVFRHSFAVHCLINRIQLHDIRDYLGHASIKETEDYTKIFTGETYHYMASVEF